MSDLVGNPEDRFSRVEAHVLSVFPDRESPHVEGSDRARIVE